MTTQPAPAPDAAAPAPQPVASAVPQQGAQPQTSRVTHQHLGDPTNQDGAAGVAPADWRSAPWLINTQQPVAGGTGMAGQPVTGQPAQPPAPTPLIPEGAEMPLETGMKKLLDNNRKMASAERGFDENSPTGYRGYVPLRPSLDLTKHLPEDSFLRKLPSGLGGFAKSFMFAPILRGTGAAPFAGHFNRFPHSGFAQRASTNLAAINSLRGEPNNPFQQIAARFAGNLLGGDSARVGALGDEMQRLSGLR